LGCFVRRLGQRIQIIFRIQSQKSKVFGGEDSEFDADWGASQSENYKIELGSSQECEQFCYEDAG
jgi:hypothetical protein